MFGHGIELRESNGFLRQGKIMFETRIAKGLKVRGSILPDQRPSFPAGALVNALVPIFGPHPIFRAWPRAPMHHPFFPSQFQSLTQCLQAFLRLGMKLLCRQHKGAFSQMFKQQALMSIAKVEHGGILDMDLVRGKHPIRMPNQEHMFHIVTIKKGKWDAFDVVGHVLEKDMLVTWSHLDGGKSLVHFCGHGGHDFLPGRTFGPSESEKMTKQRFIHHPGVRPLREAVHQRRASAARASPKRNSHASSQKVLHPQDAPRNAERERKKQRQIQGNQPNRLSRNQPHIEDGIDHANSPKNPTWSQAA